MDGLTVNRTSLIFDRLLFHKTFTPRPYLIHYSVLSYIQLQEQNIIFHNRVHGKHPPPHFKLYV